MARSYTLGAGILLAGDDPLIGAVMPERTLTSQSETTIWVDQVTTTGEIARVWGIITPPGFSAKNFAKAITNLPEIDLDSQGNGRYEAAYNGFYTEGTYDIVVFAKDTEGNISIPLTTKVIQGGIPQDLTPDVNNDNAVNAVDVQLVINAALGLQIPYSADVNHDAAVNAVDVQLVINAALGLF